MMKKEESFFLSVSWKKKETFWKKEKKKKGLPVTNKLEFQLRMVHLIKAFRFIIKAGIFNKIRMEFIKIKGHHLRESLLIKKHLT